MAQVIVLGEGVEALRTAFNEDADKPRLLMLVSPTCGPCCEGASVMQRDVLEQIDDPSLRAYVTWVPILPSDSEDAAGTSSGIVEDVRVAQFWDAQKALPGPFALMLGLPEGWPAWDVYMVYPVGATWGDAPPAPAFWHHQLGDQLDAATLDGEAFAARLRTLLGG